MYLGKLAIYAMDGLFYTDHPFYVTTTFEQNERSHMGFTAAIDSGFDHIPTKREFTPVDVNGDTQYITGNFKTSTQVDSQGELTLWLLVEEEMDIVIENERNE